ncbi:MAG: MarR family transcriptional regulator [bacterium]
MSTRDAEKIFSDIVDIVRAVRSNREIEIFQGGMEKLNFSQITALYYLYDGEEMTMGILSKLAGVKMPTMTDTISVLVGKGYASRKSAQNDRRKVIMTITEKGKKLVNYNRLIGIEYINKYLSNLGVLERKLATTIVNRTKEIVTKRFKL